MEEAFHQAIIEDLQRFSAQLLDSIGHTKNQPLPSQIAQPISTISGALSAAEFLATSTPKLLRELRSHTLSYTQAVVRSPSPKGARIPREPWAYAKHGQTLAPTFWLAPAQEARPNPQPLRWLNHIMQELRGQLQWFLKQGQKSYESLVEQEDDTYWGHQTRQEYKAMLDNIKRGSHQLSRALLDIERFFGQTLNASPHRPEPYPQGNTWRLLRRFERHWSNPLLTLPSYINECVIKPPDIADLPFLYQRWCILSLFKCLQQMGCVLQDNTQPLAWTIFLGGASELNHPVYGHIQIWVEPRITSNTHDSGLCTNEAQGQTPDIVINVQSQGSTESIILDPTLSQQTELLEQKGKYYRTLYRKENRKIAGVSVLKRPWRCWAIAPIKQSKCLLLADRDGKCGAIPMHPLVQQRSGLRDFMLDVFALTQLPTLST